MSRSRHQGTSDRARAARAYRRARSVYTAALNAYLASGLDETLGPAVDDAFFAMDSADGDLRVST